MSSHSFPHFSLFPTVHVLPQNTIKKIKLHSSGPPSSSSPQELYSQSYGSVGVTFASITNFHEFYTELDLNNQVNAPPD